VRTSALMRFSPVLSVITCSHSRSMRVSRIRAHGQRWYSTSLNLGEEKLGHMVSSVVFMNFERGGPVFVPVPPPAPPPSLTICAPRHAPRQAPTPRVGTPGVSHRIYIYHDRMRVTAFTRRPSTSSRTSSVARLTFVTHALPPDQLESASGKFSGSRGANKSRRWRHSPCYA
jgi:hypothetical protein